VDDPLPLARDVLDKQVIDPDGCKVGKVDGIVLALREHRPPRVIAMEISQATAWRRVHRRLGDFADWLRTKFEPGHQDRPPRVLFDHFVRGGIDVHVDIAWKRTRALLWEDWLEQRVIAKIPGGRRGGKKS
jgi:sporulation protein YlmC with PRC-barrel domain